MIVIVIVVVIVIYYYLQRIYVYFIQINKQRDSKTNQGKTSQDEIYIDSLQIIINDNDNKNDNNNDNHYSMNGDGMKIIS